MMKFLALSKCCRNYLDSITRLVDLNHNVVLDIIKYDVAINTMKVELRNDFRVISQFFEVDCVYLKKRTIPIPKKIKRIRLDGYLYALVHYDVLLKEMERLLKSSPNSVMHKLQDYKTGGYYFILENYSFKDKGLVYRLNYALNIEFVCKNKQILNLKPYIDVRLYGLKQVGMYGTLSKKRIAEI